MKKGKGKVSKRFTSLCSELKDKLAELDKPSPKASEPTPAQKRKVLFEELKEKLNVVS